MFGHFFVMRVADNFSLDPYQAEQILDVIADRVGWYRHQFSVKIRMSKEFIHDFAGRLLSDLGDEDEDANQKLMEMSTLTQGDISEIVEEVWSDLPDHYQLLKR